MFLLVPAALMIQRLNAGSLYEVASNRRPTLNPDDPSANVYPDHTPLEEFVVFCNTCAAH